MFKPPKKEKDPILDLILQKYIQISRDSIHGPVALKTDKKLVSINKASENKKIIFDKIPDEAKLESANLDGHNVSCFTVGGEKRLCFTEIVHTILKEVNVQEIFKKRDSLLIFTSKCTQKQLDELKYMEVLPWTTTSSNLITVSDAFRLIGVLQSNLAPKADPVKRTALSFEVYHECFGGCIGLIEPELYTSLSAPCIRCTECNGLFSIQKFVSHNHSNYDEVHTCHWGFDSSNWRSYIMPVEQNPTRELVNLWMSVKNKFNRPDLHYQTMEKSDNKRQDADFMAYINSPADNKKAMVSPIENLRNREAASAFRPWSPSPNSSKYPNSSHSKFQFPVPQKPSNRCDSHENLPLSPVYMNCKQCKTAADACNRGGSRNDNEQNCNCKDCTRNKDSVEGSIQMILQDFTNKDNRLTTDPKDLAKVLANELKKLSLNNEEKVKEIAISNQRLQTELQLVKIESSKKLSEAKDTKMHIEQELELLHRERHKEMEVFSQLKHNLEQDISNQKKTGNPHEMETLYKELTLAKTHLQQAEIDRENLRKQLEWFMKNRKNVMTDNWTPFPTMARQFSDSEEEAEDCREKSSNEGPSSKLMRLSEESDIEVEN
ncbi:ski oncogene-like [Clytia hemisphaerica]|uniref:c-SKI SMAD4-binding domain-containing protein n=1 Tax=Clytia hemisphaerica TaxID=252671 RepID=A0A7M5X6P3_9CNID|eukprot:TCONS_00056760-protein